MPRIAFATALCALLLVPALAQAQTRGRDETGSIRGGVGFTADPTTFQLGVDVPFRISENLALGPSVEAGFDDDHTFFAPTWSFEFRLPMGENPFLPYAHLGVGAAYLEEERSWRRDRDDWALLFDAGIGGDLWVTDQFAVGTRVTFHLMPEDLIDENFIFSWRVLTGRFSF